MLTGCLIIYSLIITILFVFVVRLNKSNVNISEMNNSNSETRIKNTLDYLIKIYENNIKINEMLNNTMQRIKDGKTTIKDDFATMTNNSRRVDPITRMIYASRGSHTELELHMIIDLIKSNNTLLENANKSNRN